ncbi:Smr/MutS family protein [Zavarzinia compransoris]|nr:Smr/MutS family protein [Zavarzinia compransoris]TDP43796.1 DNA-nicking Smr family endonuclease [Zavarzinia compransoris]
MSTRKPRPDKGPRGMFPGRPATEAERDLFTAAMKDVAPLASGKVAPALAPLPGARPKRVVTRLELPLSGEAPAPGARVHTMDGAKQKRLVRGELPIEARLDLHGLTQEMAHRALDRFLAQCHDGGVRSVLIITGRGRGPIDEAPTGVLYQMVPRWLNAPDHAHRVLGWHPAQRRDGGEGALYVVLKRPRD